MTRHTTTQEKQAARHRRLADQAREGLNGVTLIAMVLLVALGLGTAWFDVFPWGQRPRAGYGFAVGALVWPLVVVVQWGWHSLKGREWAGDG